MYVRGSASGYYMGQQSELIPNTGKAVLCLQNITAYSLVPQITTLLCEPKHHILNTLIALAAYKAMQSPMIIMSGKPKRKGRSYFFAASKGRAGSVSTYWLSQK